MSATEGNSQHEHQPKPRQKPQVLPRAYAVPGVSMRDLLASCAAARAISTPPRPPEAPVRQRRAAA